MLTFTRLRRPAERGMDPHNARRLEQIIVADCERAAGYATGTDICLSIGALIVIIIVAEFVCHEWWIFVVERKHNATQRQDRLPIYEAIKLVVESFLRLGNVRERLPRVSYRGNINGGLGVRDTLLESFVFAVELSAKSVSQSVWNCIYFKYQQAHTGILLLLLRDPRF